MSLKSDIIKYFKNNPGQTYKPKKLAQGLHIPSNQYPRFRKALKELVAEGKVFRYKKGRVGAGQQKTAITGIIQIKNQGYGFLLSENETQDIYINEKNLGTAMDSDRVSVELLSTRGKKLEGRVVDIIKRSRENLVGTYFSGKNRGRFIPDDSKISREIVIPAGKSKDAKDGHKVVIRMDVWEDRSVNPTGEVLEILGDPSGPGVDVLSIARTFGLSESFPKKVNRELQAFSKGFPEAELERRLDYRNELCFTIDPDDAKDFDDAVSFVRLENGNHLLGVHIADVSYFVNSGMATDAEAMKRGTSVYLVDRVIPMLPENLSNDLCSLNPDEDKLCYSVLMELNDKADVIDYKITESVIHSSKRFTYADIQKIIDGAKKPVKFVPTVLQMFEFSRKLIKKREARGGLDFGSNEVKIELDEEGTPLNILRKERQDSHRLVEEFMLLANTTVATHIADKMNAKLKRDLPFPYRVHEKPGGDKLKDFVRFLKAMGIDFSFKKNVTPKLFQQLKSEIKGTEKEIILHDVMLRTMMKARYDIKNEGHFGLALEKYCHFTSPIRRYPDLICHRLLKDYLAPSPSITLNRKSLAKICTVATEREIIAMEAERASIRSKKLQYMEKHINEVYKGVISGVVQFGLFVELIENLVEGLVHITNLTGDYYSFDEKRYCLKGENTGRKYQLGQAVTIRVLRVDRAENLVDFELMEQNDKFSLDS